jgi:hypothetical protein
MASGHSVKVEKDIEGKHCPLQTRLESDELTSFLR